jgi:hypothetical protein
MLVGNEGIIVFLMLCKSWEGGLACRDVTIEFLKIYNYTMK